MTQTGWIIMLLVAIIAIILVVTLLRRKSAVDTLSHDPVADDLLPEQVSLPVDPVLPEPDTRNPQQPLSSAPPPADVIAPASAATSPPPPEVVEPVAVAVTASPTAAPPPTASVEGGDNLLRLKGVGPKIATLLKAEGITHYAQIAAWTDTDLAAIDARLGSFAGRPTRDNWIDQARLLAADDTAGYEAKYGKL
jgi:predicted flap endonuclease-1-like 5' DNA nuclease